MSETGKLGSDMKSGEIMKENWETNPHWPAMVAVPDFIDPDGRILRSLHLEMILTSESGFTRGERCKALISILERQRDFVEEPVEFGPRVEQFIGPGGTAETPAWVGNLT